MKVHILLLFASLSAPAYAEEFYWTHKDGYWNAPGNWVQSAAPGNGDSVTIPGGRAYLPQGAITLADLIMYDDFSLPTLRTMIVTYDELRQNRRATLTVTGTFNWTGGSVGYEGSDLVGMILNLPAGAVSHIGSGSPLVLASSLVTSAGTINWTNNMIELRGGSTVYNLGNSQMNLWSDGIVTRHVSGSEALIHFAPGARLSKVEGSGHTSLAEGWSAVVLNGTITIQTGTLGFSQWQNTVVRPTLGDGLVINGPGGFKTDFGNSAGVVLVDGTVTVNGASWELINGWIIATNSTLAELKGTGATVFNWTRILLLTMLCVTPHGVNYPRGNGQKRSCPK